MPSTDPVKAVTTCWAARRSWFIALLAMGLGAYLVGYAIGSRAGKASCRDEGRRQFVEFLRIGTELGFVTVDRERLDEALITTSEAEWEDRDAEDRQRAMSTTTTINEGR